MELTKCNCAAITIFLFILTLVINPLSNYWILISYQFKFYGSLDYPIHQFDPKMPRIIQNCIVHPWNEREKLTVYDCTNNTPAMPPMAGFSTKKSNRGKYRNLTIGIASFHHYPSNSELTRYEKLVLSNHVGYAIRHRAVYFDINELIFDDKTIRKYFHHTIPLANAMFKAQKPFIINAILNDKYYGKLLDAVLWIDFDAVFLNCSTPIDSIIENAERMYFGADRGYNIGGNVKDGGNTMDLIFSRDYFSITNSGVVLFRNTESTRNFILKQMFVFQNANHFQFASIYKHVRHLIDQNVFNALILGFEPIMNDSSYLKRGRGYLDLKRLLLEEMELHRTVPHWRSFPKCLGSHLLILSHFNVTAHSQSDALAASPMLIDCRLPMCCDIEMNGIQRMSSRLWISIGIMWERTFGNTVR